MVVDCLAGLELKGFRCWVVVGADSPVWPCPRRELVSTWHSLSVKLCTEHGDTESDSLCAALKLSFKQLENPYNALPYPWHSSHCYTPGQYLELHTSHFSYHDGLMLGVGVRHSAHGKGHEEGGLTYAKAGSSLRSWIFLLSYPHSITLYILN